MLVTESRPRNLRWFHAGPLLFGDWGTSRLYVLGLAFYYTGHASPFYLALMSVIMAAVAWAYTVICRCFPDGGGVYAAARPLSPIVSVVGATLLLCDYIVTAALSTVEGFHYFGVARELVVPLSLVTILALGLINWLGARSAGRFALGIAVLAIAASALIGLLALPMAAEGLGRARVHVDGLDSWWPRWESLVRIVLALSGVEAVANMTGLMRHPVARTARRTIWPVLGEVVLLNLIFGLALMAMPALADQGTPDYIAYEVRQNIASDAVPAEVRAYRDTAVKLLAQEAAGRVVGSTLGSLFAHVSGVVFGLLLLSATNTAIMAMVAVMYSMAKDRELPRPFTRLNYSGVPWVGLLVACILPAVVLLFEADVKVLGELYAIGVVGAIAINVLSCARNGDLPIGRWERRALWGLGALMLLVELTIIIAKPHATIFAGSLVAVVLAIRAGMRLLARPPAEAPAEADWLAELRAAPPHVDPRRPKIMLAARGKYQAEFAVDLARRRRATLFVIYVRTLRLLDVAPGKVPRVEEDPPALASLGSVALLARQAGVPIVPIYVTSTDIAGEILDYTVTYGCDTLIMGKSRRSLFSRRVAGDVVAQVALHLPDNVSLITRATDTPFEPTPEPPRPTEEPPPRPTPNGDEPPPT